MRELKKFIFSVFIVWKIWNDTIPLANSYYPESYRHRSNSASGEPYVGILHSGKGRSQLLSSFESIGWQAFFIWKWKQVQLFAGIHLFEFVSLISSPSTTCFATFFMVDLCVHLFLGQIEGGKPWKNQVHNRENQLTCEWTWCGLTPLLLLETST